MSLVWKACFCAWLATITVLSLVSNPPVPEEGLLAWDKFQHAAAYGMLALLAGLAFTFSATGTCGRWLAAAVLAVAIGGLMEGAQGMLTEGRTAEWGDLLADAAGAALAAGAGAGIGARRGRSDRVNTRT